MERAHRAAALLTVPREPGWSLSGRGEEYTQEGQAWRTASAGTSMPKAQRGNTTRPGESMAPQVCWQHGAQGLQEPRGPVKCTYTRRNKDIWIVRNRLTKWDTSIQWDIIQP